MLAAALIASIQQNMTGTTPVPADVEEDGLGVQLAFGLDPDPMELRSQVTHGMFKTEKEGGRGTLGLGGGANAVHVVLLTPGNESGCCLGRLGRDRVCLKKQDYCHVAKHDKQKLSVTYNMIHIMAQATKTLSVLRMLSLMLMWHALLTEDQYVELTQEQHTVEEWNRIILAVSKGDFDTASEYNEIKQRESRALGFRTAVTPRKRVKFQYQGAARDGLEEPDVAVNAEVARVQLLSASLANTEERADFTPKAWYAMCQYINVLADQLPILQEVIVRSW
jgi:hypothetical protein